MSRIHSCADETSRAEGIRAAVDAVKGGRLVVLPTDTLYGIGADAFTPDAVQRLLDAKGRGREMPPPVLVSAPTSRIDEVDRDTFTPWLCTMSGSWLVTSCSLFWTWTCAMSGSTVSSKVSDTEADPGVEFEVM